MHQTQAPAVHTGRAQSGLERQCQSKCSLPSELAELSRIAEKRPPPHSSDSGSAPGAARSAWFRRFEGSIECPSVKVNPTSQKWCVAATTAAACAERTELTTRRLLRRLVGISIGSMSRAQSLETSNVEGWKEFGGSKCWRIYDDGRRRGRCGRAGETDAGGGARKERAEMVLWIWKGSSGRGRCRTC